MKLKIKEGKYYLTRGGDKVGPVRRNTNAHPYIWEYGVHPEVRTVDADGFYSHHERPTAADIVAEWVAPSVPPWQRDADRAWATRAQNTARDDLRAQTPVGKETPQQEADRMLAEHQAARASGDQQKTEPGWKQDAGKTRIDLIAPEFIFATADILTFGAAKYSARNWEKGMSWGRVFGALMRHLWAWWGGAGPTRTNFVFGDLDDETGKPHLWHASCCLMFLVAYEQRKIGTDDRCGA